ncbi:MAG TPA: SRPBCC family protein [Polyangiaceae bacterium]
MPEVQYTTRVPLPVTEVWEFVKDMNNWAPMLTGYQKHEPLNETDSVWTLKGDVGVLARTVRLKAHVTEWNGPERVTFTLSGLNEPVEGGGTLAMTEENGAPPAMAARQGLLERALAGLFRFLHRLRHGAPPELRAGPKLAGGRTAQLTFTLRMEASGPTGPLVNAMLGPVMLPAAEDLAKKIASHLEKTHGRTPA